LAQRNRVAEATERDARERRLRLKIGLSVAVGSGGVVALYLLWRRQHSTEGDLDNRERTLAHQQQSPASSRADTRSAPFFPELGEGAAAESEQGQQLPGVEQTVSLIAEKSGRGRSPSEAGR
jgi:hypothetical protein